MSLIPRLTTTLLGTLLLTATMAPVAFAQDPSQAVPLMCSLLDAQEVTDALGVEVDATDGDDVECRYETNEASSETLLVSSSRSTETLDDHRGFFEGEDIEVAGAPALFVPGIFSRELYVSTPDGGSYTLQAVGSIGEGIDVQLAMTGLATLAMARLADIGPLPTEEPLDASRPFTRDAELEAQFPAEIGGVPVTIESMSGAELPTDQVSPALQVALAAADRTIEDVRIAVGSIPDAAVTTLTSITAFQVKDADISMMQDALLPVLFDGQDIGPATTQQVGGKDVTSADIGGTLTYLYPRDDILWIVTAVEPALTEIFATLP